MCGCNFISYAIICFWGYSFHFRLWFTIAISSIELPYFIMVQFFLLPNIDLKIYWWELYFVFRYQIAASEDIWASKKKLNKTEYDLKSIQSVWQVISKRYHSLFIIFHAYLFGYFWAFSLNWIERHEISIGYFSLQYEDFEFLIFVITSLEVN